MIRLGVRLLGNPLGLMFLGLLLFLFGIYVNYRAWPDFRHDAAITMIAGAGVFWTGRLWLRRYPPQYWK
jgi:hypothetical protein